LQWVTLAFLATGLLALCVWTPVSPLQLSLVAITVAIAFVTIGKLAIILNRKNASVQDALVAGGSALPTYSVLVPLFRECSQVVDLLTALALLDYPKHRLDVLLLIEEEDEPTYQAAITASAGLDWVRVVKLDAGRPRTKPRALNVGLMLARGTFLTIYDAEDRPHPQQLREAVARFTADKEGHFGVFQSPLQWWNARENWLTRQLEIEYCTLFRLVLPALAGWGAALPLGGTSNHFRVSALHEAGGWDPYNVTEDADLGFRLAAHGWKMGTLTLPTREEAVVTLGAWLGQRRRWFKGFMQTLTVITRNQRALANNAGRRSLLSLYFTLAGPLLTALVHAPFFLFILAALPITFFTPITSHWIAPEYLAFTLICYAIALGLPATSLLANQRRWLLKDLALQPAYWLLQGLAFFLAIADYIARPHHWYKTDHGLSQLCPVKEMHHCQSSDSPPPSSPLPLQADLRSSATDKPHVLPIR
jgi:cellulose synthase/poly-beta-1,6-N-acetylglucosamine synthase-like glycosyltransferase